MSFAARYPRPLVVDDDLRHLQVLGAPLRLLELVLRVLELEPAPLLVALLLLGGGSPSRRSRLRWDRS